MGDSPLEEAMATTIRDNCGGHKGYWWGQPRRGGGNGCSKERGGERYDYFDPLGLLAVVLLQRPQKYSKDYNEVAMAM